MRARNGIIVYVTVAVAARSADAGAIVAAVLAGTAVGGPGAGGLLAGALTLPHLIGPLAGRLLDRRSRPGPVLAAAFLWYAGLIVLAAVTLRFSVAGAAVALAGAGCAGPLVTGGLSSRLAGIVDAGGRADPAARGHRRGQALDALTYGIAGTAGPAAVAFLATTFGPTVALAATASLLVVAAAVVLWLPASSPERGRTERGSVLRLIVVSGPLRRTTVATVGSAAALSAAPVIATALATQWGSPPSVVAVLMAAYGAGGLVASLLLIAAPLRGTPERLVRAGVAIASAALLLPLLALLVPFAESAVGAVAFGVIGAASSVLFAATLAARTEFAPPGAASRVFATVAGVKVGGSAIGVAVAGQLAPLGGVPLTLFAVALCALTLTTITLDAAVSGDARADSRSRHPGSSTSVRDELG
ncbi:hypothetical protein [Leifsonia sp. EB34]|uniref:hypothetical protein n=1 Tax=Leifsonia sp. EB34 TaxID=3156303 RepID=UPI0035193203